MSLDSQMAAVLLRLELVSHGSCQAWNASGGHSGEPDDRMVAMVGRRHDFPHLEFRRLYEQQWGDVGRAEVIASAVKELESWTHNTHKRPENTKSDDDIIIEDGKGWDVNAIAYRHRVTPSYVRRLRARRGVGIEDGKPIKGSNGSQASAEEAQRLRERGASTRQIASELGVHQTQVMRWIRSEAA